MDNTPANRATLRAKASAAGFHVRWNTRLGEFRICHSDAAESTAYYTSDIDDAFGTLALMVAERARLAQTFWRREK